MAIKLEMKNVLPEFEFIDDNDVPKFYNHIDYHMIFDVKMDLTRKAHLVADGHQSDPPKEFTYSIIVSRDSIRTAFTLAALNVLDVLSADVQEGAYLNALTKGESLHNRRVGVWHDQSWSSGTNRPSSLWFEVKWRPMTGSHSGHITRGGGFASCRGDPGVSMRPKVKPNGDKYWEYVLCYVGSYLVYLITLTTSCDGLPCFQIYSEERKCEKKT
jgi:hypothetical protein